jgi:hypothetical protein
MTREFDSLIEQIKWIAGGPIQYWEQYNAAIGQLISKYNLLSLSQLTNTHYAPAAGPGGPAVAVKAATILPTDPYGGCGGWILPHFHFNGQMIPVPEAVWKEYTGIVRARSATVIEKLGAGKAIEFRELVSAK